MNTSNVRRLAIAFAASSMLAGTAAAQQPIRVVPGWGVDTVHFAWSDVANAADVREIYRSWVEYLRGRAGVRREDTLRYGSGRGAGH